MTTELKNRPSKWLTQLEKTGKKGRPKISVIPEAAQEWAYVIPLNRYVFLPNPIIVLSPQSLDAYMTGLSHAKSTARILRDHAHKVEGLEYMPDTPQGLCFFKGRRLVNCAKEIPSDPSLPRIKYIHTSGPDTALKTHMKLMAQAIVEYGANHVSTPLVWEINGRTNQWCVFKRAALPHASPHVRPGWFHTLTAMLSGSTLEARLPYTPKFVVQNHCRATIIHWEAKYLRLAEDNPGIAVAGVDE